MTTKIKNGIIHIHTENSVKDSAMSVQTMVNRAKELGAPAIVLTDHGVMTGAIDLLKACEEAKIKGIPGVEAYKEDDNSIIGRCHLVLIPKNYDGFIAIGKAVTASNKRIENGFPRMDDNILKECFGPGTIGHQNVIATSACVGGVLARVLLLNDKVALEINKLQKKQEKLLSTSDSKYEQLLKEQSELQTAYEKEEKMYKEAYEIAKKSIKGIQKRLENMPPSDPEYQKLQDIINKHQEALSTKETCKVAKTAFKKDLSKNKKELSTYESDQEKRNILMAQIDSLKAQCLSGDKLYEKAKSEAKKYETIFGKGNFYIEVQNHGLEDEAYVYSQLAEIAHELMIPLVATNDAHFARNCKEDILARQINRSLRFNKWEDFTSDCGEYYIKTDEELEMALHEILMPDTVEEAMKGIGDIIDQCDVRIPGTTHYPKFKSEISDETAEKRLDRLARAGIEKRYSSWNEDLEKRYQYEMNIITSMGFADYLCIVQDYMNYAREEGKNNPEGVGLAVGPGRGSAAGSLICYLTGITDIDPIRFDLLFERFLNPERVSMPDIDCDFANFIRPKAIGYVKGKYGVDAVCAISTRLTQGAKAAVRNAGRIYGSKITGNKDTFLHKSDEIAKRLTPELLMDEKKKIQPLSKVKDQLINDFYKEDKDAQAIIEWAALVEGSMTGFSMHAAGIIISDNGDISDYTPLMYNTKKEQWVVQCDMVQVEDTLKLLKMDFLGLKNLDVITDTLRLIKKNTGQSIDMLNVPLDDIKVYQEIFTKGKTNCVFQFESPGMKNMLQRFQPSTIDDIILLVAAYRPGPMQYLDNIIKVKSKSQKAGYIIPQLENILAQTYGAIIYQEQVQTIFREFAGYTLGQADIVRRAMSKKKQAIMDEHREYFINGKVDQDGNILIDGCVRRGIDAKAANQLYDQISDFAAYAFNKSHAACYGILAYYTAWLKYHYPTEYLVSVIKYTDSDKLGMIINECQEFGVKVLPPDINKSEKDFIGRDKTIRFGLSSIKGVAASADPLFEERKNGKFVSFKDFVSRTKLKINVYEALIDAGACDDFNPNRKAMKSIIKEMMEIVKKMQKKDEDIKIKQKSLMEAKTKTLKAKMEKSLERAISARESYNEDLASIIIPRCFETNVLDRLARERELLGFYISGHPLDAYKNAAAKIPNKIIDIEKGSQEICGVINDYAIKITKQSKKEMAVFTLTDTSGQIECIVFPNDYVQYQSMLSEGAVLKMKGEVVIEEIRSDDDESEPVIKKKMYVKSVELLPEDQKTLIVEVNNILDWIKIKEQAEKYRNSTGSILYCFDKARGEFRNTGIPVNYSIVSSGLKIVTM